MDQTIFPVRGLKRGGGCLALTKSNQEIFQQKLSSRMIQCGEERSSRNLKYNLVAADRNESFCFKNRNILIFLTTSWCSLGRVHHFDKISLLTSQSVYLYHLFILGSYTPPSSCKHRLLFFTFQRTAATFHLCYKAS